MAYKVTVPNKSYNGLYLGVAFENGEATVEDKQLANDFEAVLGYKVEQIKSTTKKTAASTASKTVKTGE